jgi:DNA (cytosine-5)-methyltransferase 1
MTLGSLFDGISGFPLAASWCGIETKWISEIEEYCTDLHKFPGAKRYGNIYEIGIGKIYEPEPVDIICGGFPCQSFSLAGEGKMDLSLWKQMHRIICEVKPRWVVAENVLGLVARKKGVALEQVCVDLENKGFTVFPPVVIPACATGAPHRRERVWIVAHSGVFGWRGGDRSKHVHEEAGGAIKKIGGKDRVFPEVASDSSERVCEERPDWTLESSMDRIVDGLPYRMDRIKALGNAIVPQVAYEIFKAIKEIEG